MVGKTGQADMTTVLVTGANGFIGQHVCRQLAVSGHSVLAMMRRRRAGPPAIAGVTHVTGDVTDAASLRRIHQQHGPVHSIVHLATEPPGPEPRLGTNEKGMAATLETARAAGTGRIVFTSTMSVFDYLAPDLPLPLNEDQPVNPTDSYGVEKYAAEVLCRQARTLDQEVIILRLAGVYGPGKPAGAVYNFLRAAGQGHVINISEDRAVDLLWVEDAVRAIGRCLHVHGLPDVLHVGSGVALRLSDLARAAWQTAAPAGVAPLVDVGSQGNRFVLDTCRARHCLDFSPTPLSMALQAFHAHLTTATPTAGTA